MVAAFAFIVIVLVLCIVLAAVALHPGNLKARFEQAAAANEVYATLVGHLRGRLGECADVDEIAASLLDDINTATNPDNSVKFPVPRRRSS
jgi:hypothetical protein